MRRSSPLFALIGIGALATAVTAPAYAMINYVTLQTTTPGTAEAGHINITGNVVSATARVDGANTNTGTLTPGLVFGSVLSGEGISSDRTTGGVNNHGIDIYTLGAARMSIANGGKVGIGTRTPAEKLSVVGNITATGKISAINMPAIRVVKNDNVLEIYGGDATEHTIATTTVNVPSDGYMKVTGSLGMYSELWDTGTIVVRDNGVNCARAVAFYDSAGNSGAGTGAPLIGVDMVPVTAGNHTFTFVVSHSGTFQTLMTYTGRLILEYFPNSL